jgi:hypothetical protein
MAVDCSQAVQLLTKNLPIIIKTHLSSLPSSKGLDMALEEACLRVMHAYVTIAGDDDEDDDADDKEDIIYAWLPFALLHYHHYLLHYHHHRVILINFFNIIIFNIIIFTILIIFTSALIRPVTESSRLRTAKDLSAIEMMIEGIVKLSDPFHCCVVLEFK